MLPKQTDYKVGIYLRLSRDDERQGESLSIENQRRVLTNYVKEQGWTIYDEYVDNGISGVTFNRPGVERLLDDAKDGKINLILCKDLSRFGRNYIMVGQYLDYLFPMYNIRFIALTDNIDTLNSDSASMDMLPIMNVFNEWFAANTSKKLRAIFESNARSGKYKTTFAAYGYIKGDDANFTPQIDPEAAEIVRRIFEMRATGWNVTRIAETLNSEGVLPPQDYKYRKLGKDAPQYSHHLWSPTAVKRILSNPIYIGRLEQLRCTTVSYKNHKVVQKDKDDWAVIENNHEPIISQELWDKVREIEESVSTGKQTKKGITMPLSGLGYCADCGTKMKQHYSSGAKAPYGYVCGFHARFGKEHCTSHHINYSDLEGIILQDIRRQIDFVINDEMAREQFLIRKRREKTIRENADIKRKKAIEKRIADLDKLIQKIYEDKVLGNLPEKTCTDLLTKYQQEKDTLQTELDTLIRKADADKQDEADVDEYIRRLKSYAGAEELTRQMCLDLIEYFTVDAYQGRKAVRDIHIYYKLIDKPLKNKRNALEI